MAIPVIDQNTCTGCGECVQVCPSEAIALADDKAQIDASLCAECLACIDVCPVEAISEP